MNIKQIYLINWSRAHEILMHAQIPTMQPAVQKAGLVLFAVKSVKLNSTKKLKRIIIIVHYAWFKCQRQPRQLNRQQGWPEYKCIDWTLLSSLSLAHVKIYVWTRQCLTEKLAMLGIIILSLTITVSDLLQAEKFYKTVLNQILV